MSELLTIIALCTIFGYGFFLGWWARGKCLSRLERFNEALCKLDRGEIKITIDETRKGL